ncbi:MAG TPA: hypothetical protein DCZ01_11240 [Elusimicrobia bacterium]|nr:hypothetical protein [Elusimicrobiota bacterium]
MRTSLASALALIFSLTGVGSAASNAGTGGAQFLKLGAGARSAAMGDASVAVEGDAFSLYHNPAALVRLARPQIGGAHNSLFQGITYQALAFAYPFVEHQHALGLGIFYLGVGDIERRTGDSTSPVGSFNASDAAYVASYAHAFGDRMSLGVNGKYITQSLDTYSANAFAADLGALYRLNPESDRPVTAGAVVRNIGSSIGYVSSVRDPLPTSVHLGASFRPLKALGLSLETGKYRDTDLYGAFGAEAVRSFGEAASAALRLGYTSARRDNEGFNGVTAGAGLSLHRAAFDFAWVPFGALGDSFRFSLLIKF